MKANVAVLLSLVVLGASRGWSQEGSQMPRQPTTSDVRNYLLTHSPGVDPKNTVDTVKIGDPTRPVRKAGVCWYPSIETIKAAHEAGCDLLITHEPTFWSTPRRNRNCATLRPARRSANSWRRPAW